MDSSFKLLFIATLINLFLFCNRISAFKKAVLPTLFSKLKLVIVKIYCAHHWQGI